jgi:protein-S-isoprenylcysteine O-methyltransferase Ste14
MLGVLGFVSFLIFDILSLRHLVLGKYVFLLTGIFLLGYSSLLIIQTETTLILHPIIRTISLVLALGFAVLLIYSVFIEVGLPTNQAQAEPQLITNGTYSLVRHPGVIWLFLAYGFTALYFGNFWLLVTAIIWTITNTIYIVVQERVVLTKLFRQYDHYIQTTPMIIPTITSMKRFMTLQNWRKE